MNNKFNSVADRNEVEAKVINALAEICVKDSHKGRLSLDESIDRIISDLEHETKNAGNSMQAYQSAIQGYEGRPKLLDAAKTLYSLSGTFPDLSDGNGSVSFHSGASLAHNDTLGQANFDVLEAESKLIKAFDKWKQAVEENVPASEQVFPLVQNHDDFHAKHDKTGLHSLGDVIDSTGQTRPFVKQVAPAPVAQPSGLGQS